MSAGDVKVAQARGEALARREQLISTLNEIKFRLAPKTLAQEAWTGAREKGSEVADTTMTVVKERPAMVAGVAAGLALLLARKPLYGLVAGLFTDTDKTERPSRASLQTTDKE